MVSIDRALDEMRRGATIFVTHKNPMLDSDRDRFALSTGQSISKRTFDKLMPECEPVGDGLLGDSQSYRLRAK